MSGGRLHITRNNIALNVRPVECSKTTVESSLCALKWQVPIQRRWALIGALLELLVLYCCAAKKDININVSFNTSETIFWQSGDFIIAAHHFV